MIVVKNVKFLENNGLNVWPSRRNYYINFNQIIPSVIRGYRASLVFSKNMGEFSYATLSELGNGVWGGNTN